MARSRYTEVYCNSGSTSKNRKGYKRSLRRQNSTTVNGRSHYISAWFPLAFFHPGVFKCKIQKQPHSFSKVSGSSLHKKSLHWASGKYWTLSWITVPVHPKGISFIVERQCVCVYCMHGSHPKEITGSTDTRTCCRERSSRCRVTGHRTFLTRAAYFCTLLKSILM